MSVNFPDMFLAGFFRLLLMQIYKMELFQVVRRSGSSEALLCHVGLFYTAGLPFTNMSSIICDISTLELWHDSCIYHLTTNE